jgi:uncharacterized Fe-S center protein
MCALGVPQRRCAHGTHTIDVAEALGLGTQEYELVRV